METLSVQSENIDDRLKRTIESFKHMANPEIRQSKLKNISDIYDPIIEAYMEEREKALLEGRSCVRGRDSILDYDFVKSPEKKKVKFNVSQSPEAVVNTSSQPINNPRISYGRKRYSSIFANFMPKRKSSIDFRLENEKFIKYLKNKKYNSFYEKEKVLKQLSNNEKDKMRRDIKHTGLKEIRPSPGLTQSTVRLVQNGNLDNRKTLERLTTRKKAKVMEGSTLNRSDMDMGREKSDSGCDFNKWLKTNTYWYHYKDFKIDRMRQMEEDIRNDNQDDDLYFQPKINRTSKRLASSIETPICDRLHSSNAFKDERRKQLCDKYTPSFTPQTNKKSIYKKPIVVSSTKNKPPLNRNDPPKIEEKVIRLDYDNGFFKQYREFTDIDSDNELYRINVRDGSAWSGGKINSIILNRSSDIIQHIEKV
jgi:hypothetical protein